MIIEWDLMDMNGINEWSYSLNMEIVTFLWDMNSHLMGVNRVVTGVLPGISINKSPHRNGSCIIPMK